MMEQTEDKDLPNVRTLKFYNVEVNFRRNDPFGFWTVHMNQGHIPRVLQGYWTDVNEAMTKAKQYYSSKGKSVKPEGFNKKED